MKVVMVAVGQKMPAWAQAACDDYARRMPADWGFELRTVKTEPRGQKSREVLMALERERIQAALPRGAHCIALDERGRRLGTLQLAQRLQAWRDQAQDVAFVIGGPDGLDPALRAAALECWQMSELTLPHALARVVWVEQLYRAWSVSSGHPYHRE